MAKSTNAAKWKGAIDRKRKLLKIWIYCQARWLYGVRNAGRTASATIRHRL